MLSFTAIIFRHPFFDPYLSPLVKVVFLSSALHQVVFAASSSMPFAVGQVQDVGLIFLSAMASSVVEDCKDAGMADKDILATSLATLTAATALVGLLIVATGALKLASFVQFCPLPVVGGYLAFVGAFMFFSGAGLAAGVPLSVTPSSWTALANSQALIHLLPAIIMAIALSAVQRRFRSPLALPLFLLVVPLLFYAVVFIGGWSLADVRAAAWMSSPSIEDSQWKFWKVYDLYHLDGSFPPKNIYWAVLPRQIGKLVGLYFVVAFGSSMDIAAIQSDAPDVNYNSELVTVGLSNLVNGVAGVGLTGSYIFSQTLFSLRMSVSSRVMGTVVALAEAAAFIAPVNAMAYIPNFFFSALVIWIGVDIAKDWLYIAAKKVAPIEFAMLVGTFLAVAALGLEGGIFCGVLAAALHFAVEYARVSVKAFTVVPSRSGAVRSFKQRMVLEAFDGRVAAVALSGMVFFGSATTMADKVTSVAAALLESQPREGVLRPKQPGVKPQQGQSTEGLAVGSTFASANSLEEGGGGSGGGFSEESSTSGRSSLPASPSLPPSSLTQKIKSIFPVPSARTLCETYDGVAALATTTPDGIAIGPNALLAAGEALQEAPLVLLLDMSRVHGIDATAARSFLTLQSRLRRQGVRLVLTGLRNDDTGRRVRKLLVGQGLILQRPTPPNSSAVTSPSAGAGAGGGGGLSESNEECAWFPSMDEGLHWCEESFLHIAERHGLCEPPPVCVTLAEFFRSNLEVPRAFLGPTRIDYARNGAELEQFCSKETIQAGQTLFERGNPSDSIYIVECGSITCFIDWMQSTKRSRAAAAVVPGDMAVSHAIRMLEYGPGGIIGDLDFTLQRPRSFVAQCRNSGSVWRLTRSEFERLAREAPHVMVLLQTVVLRLNCLSGIHALEALERSNM